MPDIMEAFHCLTLRVSVLGSLANAADDALLRIPGTDPALEDSLNLISVLDEEIRRIKATLETLEGQIRGLNSCE